MPRQDKSHAIDCPQVIFPRTHVPKLGYLPFALEVFQTLEFIAESFHLFEKVEFGQERRAVAFQNNRGLPDGITDAGAQPGLDQVQMDYLQFIFPNNLLNSGFPSQVSMGKRIGRAGNPKKANKENKYAIQSKRLQSPKPTCSLFA